VLCWPFAFSSFPPVPPFYFLFGTHVVFVLQCFFLIIKLIFFSVSFNILILKIRTIFK
jgi:hypothetical protein